MVVDPGLHSAATVLVNKGKHHATRCWIVIAIVSSLSHRVITQLALHT